MKSNSMLNRPYKNKYFNFVLVIVALAAIELFLFFVSAKIPKTAAGYCLCTVNSKDKFGAYGAYMSITKNDYVEATCNTDCKDNNFKNAIIMDYIPRNPRLVETKLK